LFFDGAPVVVGQSISRLWWRVTPHTLNAFLCFLTLKMQKFDIVLSPDKTRLPAFFAMSI
jgi:hypothetical protein